MQTNFSSSPLHPRRILLPTTTGGGTLSTAMATGIHLPPPVGGPASAPKLMTARWWPPEGQKNVKGKENRGWRVVTCSSGATGTISPSEVGTRHFALSVGTTSLPHPDKAATGGEDSHFISETICAIGVADGVGGWRESGIDPAEYSRQFMRTAQSFLEGTFTPPEGANGKPWSVQLPWPLPEQRQIKAKDESSNLRDALAAAHNTTRVPGSSTACILKLNAKTGELVAVNLGDSGFCLVRSGYVILRSNAMQHFFDCPRQFGAYPDFVEATDHASDAEGYTVTAKPGDVIIMGTDGLWDNCYEDEILQLLPHSEKDVFKSSEQIASLAQSHSMDIEFDSPYCLDAIDNGYDIPWWKKLIMTRINNGRIECGRLRGGKMDDITVITAFVTEIAAEENNPNLQDSGQETGSGSGI